MSAPAVPVPARRQDGRRRRRLVRGAIVGSCMAYVTILLLMPLVGVAWTALKPGLSIITDTFSQPSVRHAFSLTASITVITVLVTTLLGVPTAWVLVRQRFIGRSFLNAVVDLPFALSPVTVGLAALLLFGLDGWFTSFFQARGIQIIFALPSMVLVTIFICIPFTIREIVPVLEEIGLDEEDAARTLGASVWQTFFRVTLPNIRWGLLYGIALTTARSIGEIGAVLLVSGLISGKTETATLFIYSAMEERLDAQAYVVALTLAAISVALLVVIESTRRHVEGRKHR
jgi:sulfate/thiosulfate transport system permease protein